MIIRPPGRTRSESARRETVRLNNRARANVVAPSLDLLCDERRKGVDCGPSVGGDRGVDPHSAQRASIQIVRRGEDRSDGIRGGQMAEFALMPEARLSQSPSLPVGWYS